MEALAQRYAAQILSSMSVAAEEVGDYESVAVDSLELVRPRRVGVEQLALHALPRARQNVLVELGYMAGKIGRDRVCALKKEDVELPSDFLGVLYIDIDNAGAWRLKVAKELKVAGLNVDLNNAI